MNRIGDDLLGHVFSFDQRDDVFLWISREIQSRIITLLSSYQTGMIEDAEREDSPLYRRIASYSGTQFRLFHDLVHTNGSMFGGKWGVKCPKFASPIDIRLFHAEVRRRKEENLILVWEILRQIIALRNPEIQLPELGSLPEEIEAWMEQNPSNCFGVTLRSLPFSEVQLDLLRKDLNALIQGGKAANTGPFPEITGPVLIDGEMNLQSRLAEDLDYLLTSQNIRIFEGVCYKIAKEVLSMLRELFQKMGDNRSSANTSINIHCTKGEGLVAVHYAIHLEHSNTVDTSVDPPVTLHFQVSRDLTHAHYFDEIELRERLTQRAHLTGEVGGVTPPVLADVALRAFHRFYSNQAIQDRVSNHVAICIPAPEEGYILSIRSFGGTVGNQASPVNLPVTLRMYISPDITNSDV